MRCIGWSPADHKAQGELYICYLSDLGIHLQWIDNTGSMPHPEVILKYKAPPLKRTESALTKIPSTPNINPEQMLPPLSKKDVFYSRSILDIDHYQSMRSGLTNFQPMEEDADKMEATEDVDELDEKLVPKKTCCQICCIGLRSMIDCSIMTSPTFLAYCMSGTLVILGEFHDQGDAKCIVIRSLWGHNDTPYGRPAPSRPIWPPAGRIWWFRLSLISNIIL
jgi:hypothetical protein